MFKKNISRKAYTNIGISLILIGISLMGLGVYMFLNPVEEPDPEELKTQALNKCQQQIRNHSRLNFSTTLNASEGEITIFSRDLNKSTEKVYATSIITAQCHSMNLDSFCFGEKCKNPKLGNDGGLFMKLKYKEPVNKTEENQDE